MAGVEFAILDFIQTHMRSGIGDVLMPAISALGNVGALWILLGVLALLSKKHRKTGILILGALIIDLLLCNVLLKPLVARIRPCDVNTAVQLLIPRPTDYSFPSGHTAAAFAAVTAMYLAKERYWYWLLVPAILIAFSRLYLYVHYPTDILGGILVGILSAVLAYLCFTRVQGRFAFTRKL
ncbi:MAG: phosphatase PAP2 family protein [Lachnospiraceae bacterium]